MPAEDPTAAIQLGFPPVSRGGELEVCKALVHACFTDHHDDVVLLRPEGQVPALSIDRVATLGGAAGSEFHDFASFGYRQLGSMGGGPAAGRILGPGEPPPGLSLLADPVYLSSQHINKGMSGAGVLDRERNLVVGLISDMYVSDNAMKDRDTAFAVDAAVLSMPPLDMRLVQGDAHPAVAAQPDLGFAVAPPEHASPAHALQGAPEPIAMLFGRDEVLAALDADLGDDAVRISALVGHGGEGKTSIARRWLDTLLEREPQRRALWWNFGADASVERFLAAALEHLSGDRGTSGLFRSSPARGLALAALLLEERAVVVLDGFEAIQERSGDSPGGLSDDVLGGVLRQLSAQSAAAHLVVTSRVSVVDLQAEPAYREHAVQRLHHDDAVRLLHEVTPSLDDEAIERLIHQSAGHPLTLTLLAAQAESGRAA